jgi:hypothetical protein
LRNAASLIRSVARRRVVENAQVLIRRLLIVAVLLDYVSRVGDEALANGRILVLVKLLA